MSKHRGEPEVEVFQPGDIVTLRPTETFTPTVRLVVLRGGYMAYGSWVPYIDPRPMTSEKFVKVGELQ